MFYKRVYPQGILQWGKGDIFRQELEGRTWVGDTSENGYGYFQVNNSFNKDSFLTQILSCKIFWQLLN